jgi:hemerythrin
MPVVEWNNSFLTGVKQIDEQHRHLVSLLNRSYDEFVAGATVEKCRALLNDVFDYTCYHFMEEELWMSLNSYPKAGQHIKEHNLFIRRLKEIREENLQSDSTISLEIMTFLTTWIAEHILKSDLDYGRYISLHDAAHSLG